MSGMVCPRRAYFVVAAAALLTFVASPAFAVVLIDTGFTAGEGYNDGSILFQQPNGGGNGIWLGQAPSSGMNPDVDSVAGVVNTAGGAGANGGGNFRRNAWSLGAVGGALGGDGSNELNQAGFSEGDKINIGLDYQFTITEDTANTTFFQVGVKDCFASCSFEASAFAGLEMGYSGFEDGLLRVFTDIGRVVSTPTDAAFALQISTADVGIDNGFSGEEPIDLVSDNLNFTYEAELVDASLDLWQATEVVVTNLDTETVLARASVDAPDSLESFIWNSTAVDDPFTPEDEGGVARGDGSDMFLGIQWLQDGLAGDMAAIDGIRFEYLPAGGETFASDFNGDGTVDLLDLDILGQNFGGPGGMAEGDANRDGTVDLLDLDILGQEFGMGSANSVPEPSAIVLLTIGLGAAASRRRSA